MPRIILIRLIKTESGNQVILFRKIIIKLSLGAVHPVFYKRGSPAQAVMNFIQFLTEIYSISGCCRF